MPQGTLEVLLVSAKGLENTDFLCMFSHQNLPILCVCVIVDGVNSFAGMLFLHNIRLTLWAENGHMVLIFLVFYLLGFKNLWF